MLGTEDNIQITSKCFQVEQKFILYVLLQTPNSLQNNFMVEIFKIWIKFTTNTIWVPPLIIYFRLDFVTMESF